MKQNHFKNILTRGLPKTGQVISYRADDDGDIESGWWLRRLNANNRQRFIAKTIGGDAVVLDRAFGLMWAADGDAAGCYNGGEKNWQDAIDYAVGLTFAGFSDWYLPNRIQLLSLVDHNRNSPAIYTAYFTHTKNDQYYSSTSWDVMTDNAWYVNFQTGLSDQASKTTTMFLRCVRGGV